VRCFLLLNEYDEVNTWTAKLESIGLKVLGCYFGIDVSPGLGVANRINDVMKPVLL
jgi:hypothetical protein